MMLSDQEATCYLQLQSLQLDALQRLLQCDSDDQVDM